MKFSVKQLLLYSVGPFSSSQLQRLQSILNMSATTSATIGKATGIEMNIHLHCNAPIATRPYRLSPADNSIVRNMVEELYTERRNNSRIFLTLRQPSPPEG